MKKDNSTKAGYNESFIRAAQYIVRLTGTQDVLEELAKIIVGYFGAEWVAFAGMRETEEVFISHCTMPGRQPPGEPPYA